MALTACHNTSDADLHSALVVRLRMDPRTAHLSIDVTVANEAARVTGETDTRVQQQDALEVVRSVAGIANVVNELRLSDRTTQQTVERALADEPLLAGLTINVSVYRGIVRLEGAGTDKFQRARAVGIAAQVDGVVRIDDYMR